MFIFGELFRALALLVNGISTIIYWLLFARILLSWFPVDPYHQAIQFLYQVTEPILQPFRRISFLRLGMMDFSPIAAFIALYFVNNILVGILITISHKFGLAPGF